VRLLSAAPLKQLADSAEAGAAGGDAAALALLENDRLRLELETVRAQCDAFEHLLNRLSDSHAQLKSRSGVIAAAVKRV
jgi:glycerate kinase